MKYTVEKTELIQKLRVQKEGIEKILDLKGYSLLKDDVRNELFKMCRETNTIIRKLEKNEFEIAVVGMEKAGKSSFCNALIGNSFLPTNEKRCTYTSTKITYSTENRATITFYSKKEFERDFRDKLSKLGIENSDKYEVSSMTLDQYKILYDTVNDEKKRLYNTSINEEIKDIIQCKSDLLRYLDCEPEIFVDKEIHSKQCRDYITEPRKAMAVKEAIFNSSILENMPNAIIYDVPGFNSTTEMQHIQTKSRMDSADAIILVAAADAPSITGDLLKIFKECDEDGTRLAEKLFVFANKADRSNKLSENIEITYHDWGDKYKILSDKSRFIFGSSNAYLQKLGKLGVDEKNINYIEAIKNSFSTLNDKFKNVKVNGSESNGFGIVAIRKALEKYNDTERFKVLQKRTAILQEKLFEMLSELSKQCASLDNNDYNKIGIEEALKFQRDFKENIKALLQNHRISQKAKMENEKPLSSELLDFVEKNINLEKYNDFITEKLEQAKLGLNVVAVDESEGIGIDKIESQVRNDVFEQMYVQDFFNETMDIVSKYYVKSGNEILDLFMKALKVEKDSKNYSLIRADLAEELRTYINSSDAAAHYQSLIERYSRDIYEILIGENYTASRYARFRADINTFFSMSVYYDPTVDPLESANLTSILNNPLKNNGFCYQMLCHNFEQNRIEETKDKAISCIKSYLNINEIPKETMELVSEIVQKDVIGAMDTILDIANRVYENDDSDNETNRKAELKDALKECQKKLLDLDIADEKEFLKVYKSCFSPSRKYSDIVQDLKDDIIILKDVLLHCTIRALSLEKPYIAKEYIIIDNIITHIDSNEFLDFISSHISLILSAKFDELESSRLKSERNAICYKEIEKIMNNMRNATE